MKRLTYLQIKDLFRLRRTNPSRQKGLINGSFSLSEAIKEAKCSEGDCGGDGKHIFKKAKNDT